MDPTVPEGAGFRGLVIAPADGPQAPDAFSVTRSADLRLLSMKKNNLIKKPMTLSTQTVRALGEQPLSAMQGGAMNNSLTRCYASGCTCSGYFTCK